MEDIEMVASLHSNSNREELQDEKERRQRIVHTLQSFAMFFITGMNDGNLGVILPSIRAHYGLSQSIVSVLFLCTTAGYFIGECFVDLGYRCYWLTGHNSRAGQWLFNPETLSGKSSIYRCSVIDLGFPNTVIRGAFRCHVLLRSVCGIRERVVASVRKHHSY